MVVSLSQQNQLWNRILSNIKERVEDKHIYDSFFANTKLHKVEGDIMYICVDSKLSIKLIEGNSTYTSYILDSIKEVTETEYKIRLLSKEEIVEKKDSLNKDSQLIETKERFFSTCCLNAKYNFDNFVVGSCNKEAVQASLLVTQSPGTSFNPLFLYSKPGLGKTHLLHAIGNFVKEKKPYAKVIYITTDAFIDEYIKYVHGDQQEESLKDFLKSCDVLLVDDIQSLADKQKTQEMFFYIFNALVNNNKQIVLTSDRHPSELKGLEDRLVSRFNMGLSINLQNPDTETLLSILKTKIEANGLDVNNFDYNGLVFLAENFSKNVRELEGALNRLIFYTITTKHSKKIDIQTIKDSVKPMMHSKDSKKVLSEEKIISTVCEYYHLTENQIKSKSRLSQIALARQIAMYLCRSMLGTPYKQIGVLFGGRDHSTVITSVDKVETMLKTDSSLSTALSKLQKNLKN